MSEQTIERAPANAKVRGGKFLTFGLSSEEYGIEILKVQEIIGYMAVTPVPRMPSFIRGVINLRGKIIPIIDLRLKLSMESAPTTEQTCVIVVKANGIEIGVVVDKVSEVLDIADRDIEDAPSFGAGLSTDYILGIGKAGSKVKLLLDIEKVLSKRDLEQIGAAKNAEVAAQTENKENAHAK